MKVTVLDLMNYVASKGMPISGVAIQALLQGVTADSELGGDDASIKAIRVWKRRESRLYNRIYRWLKWQYYRRRLGL